MQKNYLNLKNSEICKPLFRVLPVDQAIEIFNTNQLTLVRPKLWKDPFENFILKNGSGKLNDGTLVTFPFHDDLYGQCWSFHMETNFMWDHYSIGYNTVKIKTTIDKLYKALYQTVPNSTFAPIECFIGKVEYLTRHKFYAKMQSINLLDSKGKGIAESLLIKRKAFQCEREIRLIYHDSSSQCNNDLYRFGIQPIDLIDELIFHPDMPECLFQIFKQHFVSKGFNKKIKKSDLYKPPANFVFNIQ